MPIRYKKYSSAQIFKTSSAFLEYRRFEARRAVELSAHCLPIKRQNCRERRLQVEHFTPSIPDATHRLRKHGCLQKRKFRYFKLKSRGLFAFRFRSSPPFSLFLFSFLVLGIDWASFRRETFWRTQDLRD